jgi:hypothetical protein
MAETAASSSVFATSSSVATSSGGAPQKAPSEVDISSVFTDNHVEHRI